MSLRMGGMGYRQEIITTHDGERGDYIICSFYFQSDNLYIDYQNISRSVGTNKTELSTFILFFLLSKYQINALG